MNCHHDEGFSPRRDLLFLDDNRFLAAHGKFWETPFCSIPYYPESNHSNGLNHQHSQEHTPWYATGFAIVALIAGLRLLLHLLTANRYGVFRDEMYYLDCAQHLDWGYVDQPPVIAAASPGSPATSSAHRCSAIRLLPALAGAGDGRANRIHRASTRRPPLRHGAVMRWSIALSAVFVINGHLLTMNVFEPLIWMGCASVVIRIIQTGNQKLWLWFGLLAGIGLETKYSMAVYGLGIMVGVVLTPERKRPGAQMDLAGRRAGVPDLPAQPALEHSSTTGPLCN